MTYFRVGKKGSKVLLTNIFFMLGGQNHIFFRKSIGQKSQNKNRTFGTWKFFSWQISSARVRAPFLKLYHTQPKKSIGQKSFFCGEKNIPKDLLTMGQKSCCSTGKKQVKRPIDKWSQDAKRPIFLDPREWDFCTFFAAKNLSKMSLLTHDSFCLPMLYYIYSKRKTYTALLKLNSKIVQKSYGKLSLTML